MPDSGAVDGAFAPNDSRQIFTHKMIKQTSENQFASLAYECPHCSFEQWDSIAAPDGWNKGPFQVALFSNELSEMRSYPTVEGHPDSVDFLEDVPGNEYRVIAIMNTESSPS